MFALYESFSGSHYDDGGTDSRKTLLAIDYSVKALRDRWNAKVKTEKSGREKSPLFKTGTELKYSGSTGGGYASVSYRVTIEEYKPWDDELQPKLTDKAPSEKQIRKAVFTEISTAIQNKLDDIVEERDDCGNDTIRASSIRDYERFNETKYGLSILFDEFDDVVFSRLKQKIIRRKKK